eukprot:TRINITY_DN1699_c0_g1_i32.p1 TRINITY_DN1699_c0_g1~~TRINITY_DN1699_c0_g1_i32.p1  ORF type:complete len:147 (+),score=34.93 TRINITY_DN1699_c0_g1_i32:1073-1513(+)
MVEIDKAFSQVTSFINSLVAEWNGGVRFSLVKEMVLVWNKKIYSKIKPRLMEAFVKLLRGKRVGELEREQSKVRNMTGAKSIGNSPEFGLYNRDCELELLSFFIQYIADLSIDEVTVHYLGSTKAVLDTPYSELHEIIISQTEYCV